MRRISQLVGLYFSTGRAISLAPGQSQCARGSTDFHDVSRAPTETQVELEQTRVHICVFAKLLLPAWEIGVQLKTKNNGAYGLRFESMNSPISSWSSIPPSLNDVEVM
jgi:hypothetical protein